MARVYNFSAGPAMLPEPVLSQARDEMLDWQGSGMCVAEMSHRGKEFMSIAAQAEADLRELLQIPANYKVLFLQGGASTQFAMIPMNLLRGGRGARTISTPAPGPRRRSPRRAVMVTVNVAASTEAEQVHPRAGPGRTQALATTPPMSITRPTRPSRGSSSPMCPETNGKPLVADMSSTLLSRPIDVSRFGLIYAGAQKNIGPAGLTIVIVREDLIGQPMPGHADHVRLQDPRR